MKFSGPGTNFDFLFEDSSNKENGLPPELRSIYGGDWCLPILLPRSTAIQTL